MYAYIERCNKHKIKSKYLFVYKYNNIWKPVSASTFRRELKYALKLKYKNKYNPKIHRAHSYRYGGITSLGSIGIPKEYIRRISGHSPDSKVLEQYLKITSKNIASLIKRKIKQYKKWRL